MYREGYYNIGDLLQEKRQCKATEISFIQAG